MTARGRDGRLFMGITNANNTGSANNQSDIRNQRSHMAAYLYDNSQPKRFTNGVWAKMEKYANTRDTVDWNIGDRLRLDIDCGGRQCIVFLNDEPLGILTNKLPQHFCLMVSVCYKGTTLETSFCEIVKRRNL